MSGDYICPHCQGYWGQHNTGCPTRFVGTDYVEHLMSMRDRMVPRMEVPIMEALEKPDVFSIPEDSVAPVIDDLKLTPKVQTRNAMPMTKKHLIDFLTSYMNDPVFAQRFADCIDMLKAKNADYSQGEQKGDRIAAFRRIGRDIDVPMPKVWAIFAQKHWGAIMKYVKDGILESESLDGRINDLVNYFVLLGAIVDDQKVK